jgi:hypothetical protein
MRGSVRRTGGEVSLVAKVKDTAGDMVNQARAKYSESDAMQKAGRQAGQAASQAGQAANQMAGKLRDTQLAGRLKELAGKTTSAVKGARTKGPADQ